MSYYVNKRMNTKEGTIDISTGELQPDFGTVRVYCDKLKVDYNDKINVSTDSKESNIGVHVYRSDNTQIKNVSLKTPSAQLTIDSEDASYIRIRFDDNTTQYKPSYAEFNSVIERNEIEKLPQTATFTEVNQVNEKIYENLNLNKKCLGELLKQKGINVLETDGTFDLINKVASIEDKRWAKGDITNRITFDTYSANFQPIPINFNLDFTPSRIFLSFQQAYIYSSLGNNNTSIDSDFANSESSYCELHSDERQPFYLYIDNITSKGFNLYWKKTNNNGTYSLNPKITWYAYE